MPFSSIVETKEQAKGSTEVPTVSREWLHGSKPRSLSWCTFWYCCNKCKQANLFIRKRLALIYLWHESLSLSFSAILTLGSEKTGTWHGEKIMHIRLLSIHWDVKRCCWGHCIGEWGWGMMPTVFILWVLFFYFKLRCSWMYG